MTDIRTDQDVNYDVAIIGAGAAGLFAAAAMDKDKRCILLEKNNAPGKKLLLSGSGQCNLTHSGDIREFLNHYGEKGRRIRPLLYKYSNRHMEAFFEQAGLPLTHRQDGKVFPQTMSAQDVLSCLLEAAGRNRTELRTSCEITNISKAPGTGYILSGEKGFRCKAKKVLVTTGGCSYPKTGSDGSFFSVLEGLGISVTDRKPALVPLCVEGYPYSELSGISIENCLMELVKRKASSSSGAKPQRFTGDLLFTHRCFSGPVILNASRYADTGDTISLSYLPAQTSDQLYQQLISSSAGCSRQIVTLLCDAPFNLPRRLSERLLKRTGLEPSAKASQLSGRQLKTLASIMTRDSFTLSGTTGFATAMVTAGGVDLKAVDLKTMEALECPGVFLAGEALDVDGDTGGYNIQFAYSSAVCAAASM